MSKRKRFIVTSILLSLGFIGVQALDIRYKLLAISALAIFTLPLFYWSLREGLDRDLTLMSLVLPFFFTLGVGLFWFLIPASLFARVPVVILFGLGIYALCLTSNIYTVAAIRTIALLRAARGVGFVLTLLTFFLIYNAILSIRAPIFLISPLAFVSSLPLFLQGFWTIPLVKEWDRGLFVLAAVSSLIMAEIVAALFFWPVTVVVGSLFLTVGVYVTLGLGQARLEARLFPQTVREYLLIALFVFLGMFIATSWGG